MATDPMNNLRGQEVTELLRSCRQGDGMALDRLVPLVHAELCRVARSHIRRQGPRHTLQATALVNETYLRLVGIDHLTLNDRTHFFETAETIGVSPATVEREWTMAKPWLQRRLSM